MSSKHRYEWSLMSTLALSCVLSIATDTVSMAGSDRDAPPHEAAAAGRTMVAVPFAATCMDSKQSLTLRAGAIRVSGISPFTVFFDATGTSSTATDAPFRHIEYRWNFGDLGNSGRGSWSYGSNPGHNSLNMAMGAVAAHVYEAPQVDTVFSPTVTAYDGISTTSCHFQVTVFAASGPHGFPRTETTCAYNSAVGVGCPAGARKVATFSLESVFASGSLSSGKRLLLRCGDSFSAGSTVYVRGVKWSIGAYGPCVGKTIGRPLLRMETQNDLLDIDSAASDGRVIDLSLNGNRQGVVGIGTADNARLSQPTSITILNVDVEGFNTSFRWNGGRYALINSTSSKPAGTCGVGVFINFNAGVSVAAGTVYDMDYQALMGNLIDNGGGNSCQAVRAPLLRLGVIENNTVRGAGRSFGELKLHNSSFQGVWQGIYSELDEVTDNSIGDSTASNLLLEMAPQNSQSDERIRDVVVERNLFIAGQNTQANLLLAARDVTVADNIFQVSLNQYAISVEQRGIEPPPDGDEIYNNTFYATAYPGPSPATAIRITHPVSGARVVNNLCSYPGAPSRTVCVGDEGNGNFVGDNSPNVTTNPRYFMPLPIDAVDYRPRSNISRGRSVPVWSDFFGIRWPPAWYLGAIHP